MADSIRKKSGASIRPRRIGRLAVFLAILAQLHLFFVLELHHEGAGLFLQTEAAAFADSQPRFSQPKIPEPLCPACQIARQGAVSPAVDVLALSPLFAVISSAPEFVVCPHLVFIVQSSGRDPPASPIA
jgi:hypothetical protein